MEHKATLACSSCIGTGRIWLGDKILCRRCYGSIPHSEKMKIISGRSESK